MPLDGVMLFSCCATRAGRMRHQAMTSWIFFDQWLEILFGNSVLQGVYLGTDPALRVPPNCTFIPQGADVKRTADGAPCTTVLGNGAHDVKTALIEMAAVWTRLAEEHANG